jgi:hypothetical protein
MLQELHNMECELVAQREQMAARHREQMEEKEKIKRLKVTSQILTLFFNSGFACVCKPKQYW